MSEYQQDRTKERAVKLRQYLETLTDAVIAQTKMFRTPEDIRAMIREELRKFGKQVGDDCMLEVGQYGKNSHAFACLRSYVEMISEE